MRIVAIRDILETRLCYVALITLSLFSNLADGFCGSVNDLR